MDRKIAPGQIYQHFKGGKYEIVALAHDSEDEKEVVVYKALYDHEKYGSQSIWVRSKDEFLENVTRDGKTFERFKLI